MQELESNEVVGEISEVITEQTEHVTSIFQGIGDFIKGIFPSVGFAVIILLLGLIFAKFLMKFVNRTLQKSKLDPTACGFLQSLIRVILYVLVIVIVLSVLNVPMTSIITVIGTISLTIGLALQDSLANVAGGFLILFSKPLKVGDLVEFDGITGTVEIIGILQTKMKKADGTTVFIPNRKISDAVILNYSEDQKRRLDLNFGIGYDSDENFAKTIISGILDKHESVLHDQDYTVRVGELADSAVIIHVRVWTTNENYWKLYYDLQEKIKKAFDQNHISIPYPQADIHIHEVVKS
ncbi:MAG: mechanosensitive ion channel [Oscillospiraceae bacterium]|nr:mechanosensitive ion channel [Oscillospiraceae bacterium]